MAILVTGGAGYIGGHMALMLADEGHDVVVVDNLVTGFAWSVDKRVRFIEADVGDSARMASVIQDHHICDIVHFAGSIIVPESVTDPLKYYANNTCVTRSLIENAVAGGVENFIFSSTAAVYGMAGAEPVSETAALDPLSPYGRSKLMSEWMLADVAASSDLTYGILRYFNVAGADPAGRLGQSTPFATHLIKVACQTALGQRDEMQIFGTDFDTSDGTGIRDYIHVSDLVAAHGLLLDHLRGGGASITLNCGYGRGFSVREVIDTVKAVTGVDFAVTEVGRRAGDPAAIVALADRVRTQLGWQPAHDSLEEIVATAFEWEKHLGTRNDPPPLG
ncbi:MAG: UDP-glucose 4-epimerase GalE [Alphaproteobacteria bacterium]|nr:UDP-glucose 4-epimerase GalE [Alphaproteobacteria bacterium]